MKIVFIQGGSRWKLDQDGNIYTDANLNETIWERYRNLCDELVVILRQDSTIYSKNEAVNSFNLFDTNKNSYCILPDLYSPTKNYFSYKLRKETKMLIDEQIKSADKVIVREPGNYYTNYAVKASKKYNKEYLVEVTSCIFDVLWNHGLKGKVLAYFTDYKVKKIIRNSPYALYVTKEALQKRYPTDGKSLGCSDVDVSNRNYKQRKKKSKIQIGTAAFLDVDWKAQKDVIRALALLRKQGIECFEYHLVGNGTGNSLLEEAKKQNVKDLVVIDGSLPHEQMKLWYEKIDLYVQPSYQEGLCRSIVEAMASGCAVVCSDVGGNYELIDRKFIYPPKDIDNLARLLVEMTKNDNLELQSKINYEKAKEYEKEYLDSIRNDFFNLFAHSE